MLSVASRTVLRQPCHHSAPHFGAGLKPENETDFSQAARGEAVWFDCNDDKRYPAPLQCGRMKARLDWTNADHDSRNASIAVIFYPAGAGATPNDQVLGSLLTNPGGPGGSGLEFLARKNAANKKRAARCQP